MEELGYYCSTAKHLNKGEYAGLLLAPQYFTPLREGDSDSSSLLCVHPAVALHCPDTGARSVFRNKGDTLLHARLP